MGGRGSGSGRGSGRKMTARELVNSIRNSGPNGSGIALSVTNSAGRELMKIAPGDSRGSFNLITTHGTVSLTRKEALGYVREFKDFRIKQVKL